MLPKQNISKDKSNTKEHGHLFFVCKLNEKNDFRDAKDILTQFFTIINRGNYLHLGGIVSDLEGTEQPIIYCDEDNRMKAFAFPPFFLQDIYWAISNKDKELIISNDLFDLAGCLGQVTIDETQLTKFLTKGFCSQSRTIFNEVQRFAGWSIYTLVEDGLKRETLPFPEYSWKTDDECYECFKSCIERSFERSLEKNENRQHYLLLSGGVDSRTLLLLFLKHGIHLNVRSVRFEPYTPDFNVQDVELATIVCKRAGIPIKIEKYDYSDYDHSDMEEIIRMMPCSAHLTLNFKAAMNGLPQDNHALIWTGQNMDTVYNLGPTEPVRFSSQGIAQWFERFYLSELFFNQLPDIECGQYRLQDKLISKLGLFLFSHVRNRKTYSLPNDALDLIHRFAATGDHTMFEKVDNATIDPDALFLIENAKPKTAQEVRKVLLSLKIALLSAGDPRSMCISAVQQGAANIVFPYSTVSMFSFFSNLPMTKKDVWRPKRYVYKYAKELSQSLHVNLGDFRLPNRSVPRQKYNLIGMKDYFESLLHSSFGISLALHTTDGLKIIQDPSLGPLRRFDLLLRSFWLETTIRFASEAGANVTVSNPI